MSTITFKVINLLVRTIAKPIVSWVTHHKKLKFKLESDSKAQNFTRFMLINVGQKWNYYNILINRKLFKISTHGTTISELPEATALERGAEVIGEIFVYSVLLIIPIVEWYRLSKISKSKEKIKELHLHETRIILDSLIKESEDLNREIQLIRDKLDEIENKLSHNLI